jgi:hypothetical protein
VSPVRHLSVLAGWEVERNMLHAVSRAARILVQAHPPFEHGKHYEIEVSIRERDYPVAQGSGPFTELLRRAKEGLALHPNCNEALKGVPPKCECGADKGGGRHSKWCPLYVPPESP